MDRRSLPLTAIVANVSNSRNTLHHEGKYASHDGLTITRQHVQVYANEFWDSVEQLGTWQS
jgi:hypothetical protein